MGFLHEGGEMSAKNAKAAAGESVDGIGGDEWNMAALKKKCEELLRADPEETPALPTADVQKLFHELNVHQIELQMQNEELRNAQAELAHSRDDYAELYDFAPDGYLTLDPDSRILDANFTAATLLGTDRGKLIGKPFAAFVHRDSISAWDLRRRQCAECVEKHGEDYLLQRPDGGLFTARVECTTHREGGPCFMALSDITQRVQAEALATEAAARWQTTFDAMADAVFILDVNQRVLRANKAAESVFGCSAEQMQGRPCWEIVHGTEGPEKGCPVQRMLKTRRRESMELPFDDSVFQVTADPLIGEDGQLRGAVHIVRDITNRKQAEEALRKSEQELAVLNHALEQRVAERTAELRESEQRFRTLFEEAPDACFLLDSEGRFLAGNLAVERLIGYPSEELVGRPMLGPGILDEGSIAAATGNLAELARGGQVPPTEYGLRHKDGTIIPVEISGMPVLLRGRTVVLGSARDLTSRRQVEKTLRESEERFRAIFDQIPDGILVADPETRKFHMASQAFCSKMGYTEEQVLEMGSEGIHPAEDLPYVIAAFEKQVRGEQEIYDIPFLRRDGGIFYADMKAFRIVLDGKQLLLGHIRDVTERKRMQEALEKRVLALTQPLDQPESISFDELFDLQQIQRLQDEFSSSTGVASIITRPDGSPITKPSHFTDFCAGIVRQTEKGRANCFKSDAMLGRHHPEGPIVQQCLGTGLWDAGACLEVGGRHIANWLIGQVRDGPRSDEQMRTYAREIGADEAAFMEAFERVPVMPREHFEAIAQVLFTLANQLSTAAYQNVQQARFIAAQKKAEEALSESEEKYRLVFESETDSIMIFDGETRRFIDVNNAAEKLYGYTREEFLQLNQSAISAEPDDSDSSIRATIAGRITSVPLRQHRKKDGTVFPVEIAGCTFAWQGRRMVCGVIRDISERVAREDELARNQKELRKLASELSLAEQRERDRIARELHDGVSQMLSSSFLRLKILHESPLPEKTLGEIHTICGIVEETLRQTRSLTFELSCPMLSELGLAAALEELCSSMSHEKAVRFEFFGDMALLPLSPDRRLVLYRCARELLINVMKHSGAKQAWVELERTDGGVHLFVADDGRGFDASMAGKGFSPSGGFGLFNIREYLQHAGGELRIESILGDGTQVAMTVPLETEHG
jgi:PAS domain S-box-containing protein